MLVLLAIDGSAASVQAARLIAGYRSDRSRAVPVLLNVQSPPLRAWPGAGLDQTVVEAALREQGARELETVRSILAQAGFAAETVVRVAYPPDAIMDEARQRNVGAIVMGTRGRGALDGFAFGSVALRVAHGSEFPVVLVKPDARLPAELGRRARVVVPVDGSHEATQAAVRLAQWRDWLGELRVDVLHFQRPLTVLEAVMPPHGDALMLWRTGAASKHRKRSPARETRSSVRESGTRFTSLPASRPPGLRSSHKSALRTSSRCRREGWAPCTMRRKT